MAVFLNTFPPNKKDKAIIARTNKQIVNTQKRINKTTNNSAQKKDMYFLDQVNSNMQYPFRTKKKKEKFNITYKKRQVIIRKDQSRKIFIPSGKKIIAKLSNSLDSRLKSTDVTAIIPFAVKFKGIEIIQKDSILLGKSTHPEGSDRMFISFSKCIYPNGRKFSIKAQALDSKDYQVGIIGTYYNKTGARIAKSIALGMISPMAQTLTEKEALGQGFIVTAKPKIKNALLQGLSKSSEIEAKRQIGNLKSDQDYITISSGKEIIVVFLSDFKG